MNIIPLMRCRDMERSLTFYTGVLDFVHHGTWPETGSPSFSILSREDAALHLSSHSGDGVFGHAVSIMVQDIDHLFQKFVARGLNAKTKMDSPVHQGPTDQTWGTREFYVDDPDGNTLRFVQLL